MATGTAGSSPTAAMGTTSVTDQAVIDYLKSKGMGKAVSELTQKIKEQKQAGASDPLAVTAVPKITREQLEAEEDIVRTQRTILVKSTGGGYGYDRDAAAPIAQWGVPDSLVVNKENSPSAATKGGRQRWAAGQMGEREAKSYLDAFVALQLWILSLPDDSAGVIGWQPKTINVIAKARALILAGTKEGNDKDNGNIGVVDSKEENKGEKVEGEKGGNSPEDNAMDIDKNKEAEKKEEKDTNLSKEVEKAKDTGEEKGDSKEDAVDNGKERQNSKNMLSTVLTELSKSSMTTEQKNNDLNTASAVYPIPPSAKAELLSVSFALLVHTYCELLEVGMESTAHVLRDAFRPIYDPLPSGYGTQYKDLYQCVTTEDMVKLNTHNSQHMDALANLKTILVQVASIQVKKKEMENAIKTTAASGNADPNTQQARQKKVREYDQTMGLLQQKHTEVSQRASHAYDRMYDLPFLRRARAVRWQLTLSTTSYGMLCQFLNSNVGGGNTDTSLLAMSTLLQTKCELHVEQRDPLPFTPVVVLEDDSVTPGLVSKSSKNNLKNKAPVRWAAPMKGLSPQSPDRPFPKFHLEEEYESEQLAQKDKRVVEFNRSLLINGFRRLEALERKRDFQVMRKGDKKEAKNSSVTKTNSKRKDVTQPTVRSRKLANPLEPSIMLSTLCANQNRRREDVDRSHNDSGNSSSANFLWEESGIGITCASLSPPDGRKVAIGCDDSAIRIWNLMDNQHKSGGSGGENQTSAGDAGQVLLGHKNGFPVFDLSWNRDGRSLLSAGGDGSIRLWDTSAQGPFGEVIQSSSISGAIGPAVSSTLLSSPAAKKPAVTNTLAKEKLAKATERLETAKNNPEMNIPGLRPESTSYTSGAALAVYRGHAPNTPIWSVAFSPSGYYFASGGSDATARLWTTDRPVPVRLFTGHTSNCVHSVVFHPNCNYVLSGGEDKTVRLWDVQTGQCVRLLNGCPAGIYKVDIDPSGQYAVGADVLGTVHVWDLATGKKVTELRSSRVPNVPKQSYGQRRQGIDMIHSFAFSPCGSALATGGDDRTVRIWDIRKATKNPVPVLADPIKSFATRRTVVLDLQYTKRNLLLSVGKYISAV